MQKAPAETYKPAGKGKKKTSAKGTVGLIIEALAAAAACALLVVSYRTYMDPGAAAEKFLEAEQSEDWAAVYDMFDTSKLSGDFTSKEAFITAQEVAEKHPWHMDRKVKIKKTEVKSSTFSNAKVRVDYKLGDISDKRDLSLRRDGFSWKVDPKDYLYSNGTICAPEGMDVKMDGIELKDGETEKKGKGAEAEEAVFYHIGDYFGTYHLIEVSGKDIDKTCTYVILNGEPWNVYTYSYADFDVESSMPYLFTDYTGAAEDVFEQADADFREMMDLAGRNGTADQLSFITVGDGTWTSETWAESYDKIRLDLFGFRSGTPSKIEISNVEAVTKPGADGQYAYVTFTGTVDITNGSSVTTDTFSIEMHYRPDESGESWVFDALYYSGNK